MKIAILFGSIRIGRQTERFAHCLTNHFNNLPGIEATLIDLAKTPLPMMEERIRLHPNPPENLLTIGQILRDANAIVLLSPEYHGSYSGVLKNALDYFGAEFVRKAVGVATASAGKLGGINASTLLQQLILPLGGYPMPYKLLISGIAQAFDENNLPIEEQVQKNIAKFADELLWLAQALERQKMASQ